LKAANSTCYIYKPCLAEIANPAACSGLGPFSVQWALPAEHPAT